MVGFSVKPIFVHHKTQTITFIARMKPKRPPQFSVQNIRKSHNISNTVESNYLDFLHISKATKTDFNLISKHQKNQLWISTKNCSSNQENWTMAENYFWLIAMMPSVNLYDTTMCMGMHVSYPTRGATDDCDGKMRIGIGYCVSRGLCFENVLRERFFLSFFLSLCLFWFRLVWTDGKY